VRPGSLVRTKLPFWDVPRDSIGLVVAVEDKPGGPVCVVTLAKHGPASPVRYDAQHLEEISNR